jgi:hypothetical protein
MQETERITGLIHQKTKEINLQQEMYKRYPFPLGQAGVDLKEIHNNINKRLLQNLSTLQSQRQHLKNTPTTPPPNQFVQIDADTASIISTSMTAERSHNPYAAASHRGLPPLPTTALSQDSENDRFERILATVAIPGLDESLPFADDTDILLALNRRVSTPILYIDEVVNNDKLPAIQPATLVTLDPVATNGIVELALDLRKLDSRYFETAMKFKTMESPAYIAKPTRVRAVLSVVEDLKESTPIIALCAEFKELDNEFQVDGTAIYRKYVALELEHILTLMREKLLQGIFNISKLFVTSRQRQGQINSMVNLMLDEDASETIPESDNCISKFVMILILISPTGTLLGQHTKMNRYQLFNLALKKHQMGPKPSMIRSDKIADDGAKTPNGSVTSVAASAPTHAARASQPTAVTPAQKQDNSPTIPNSSIATDYGQNTPGEGDTPAADNRKQPQAPTIQLPEVACGMEIYLGNRYFPKPLKEAWAIAREIANILQGPFTNITAEQHLKTLRATTRARTASAAKELQLHKDIFRATRTVHDIIEQAKNQNVPEQRAIAALTKFRREHFSKTRNMINQELRARKLSLHSSPANTYATDTTPDATPRTPTASTTENNRNTRRMTTTTKRHLPSPITTPMTNRLTSKLQVPTNERPNPPLRNERSSIPPPAKKEQKTQ